MFKIEMNFVNVPYWRLDNKIPAVIQTLFEY